MNKGWPKPDSIKIDNYMLVNHGNWDPLQSSKTFDQYISDVAVPQVKELLTNYGLIAMLFWDTPMNITDEQETKLQ